MSRRLQIIREVGGGLSVIVGELDLDDSKRPPWPPRGIRTRRRPEYVGRRIPATDQPTPSIVRSRAIAS